MAKVTSKRQVTLPKRLADHFGIKPGDNIVWEAQPDAIRVTKQSADPQGQGLAARLRLFDQATQREDLRRRQRTMRRRAGARGWTREELYTRGRAR